MSKLTTIEGIGETLSQRLKESGVGSTITLLRRGATRRGRREISEYCGIAEGRVLKFVNHADLMRIKGIGGEYAELLEAAGVDSVPELRTRNPVSLASHMAELNGRYHLVRIVPSVKMVAEWISQARHLDPIVAH